METTQSWKWKMSIQNICRRNVLKWNIRGHLIQVFLKPNPLSHGYNRYQGRSHLYIAKEHSEQNFKNLTRYQDFLRHWNLSFNIDEQILPLLSSFWDHRNHLLHANLILFVKRNLYFASLIAGSLFKFPPFQRSKKEGDIQEKYHI